MTNLISILKHNGRSEMFELATDFFMQKLLSLMERQTVRKCQTQVNFNTVVHKLMSFPWKHDLWLMCFIVCKMKAANSHASWLITKCLIYYWSENVGPNASNTHRDRSLLETRIELDKTKQNKQILFQTNSGT